MIKLSVAELKQALELHQKSSIDTMVLVKELPGVLEIQFQALDGSITRVSIFDESTSLFAKVESTERLLETLQRLKGSKV